jgi:DNA-binding CsgD family transcriptional regulator
VKVDIHKDERPFERISYSDTDCIKALIKNRSEIDCYFKQEQDNYFDHAGNVQSVNQELIVIYADLDRYIAKADLNSKQRFIIEKLMDGWTEKEIAKMFNRDVSNIYRHLTKIAKKIRDLNNNEWKEYVQLNHVRVAWNYKQCAKCNEFKPMLNEFFLSSSRFHDGFYDVCRMCK